MRNNEEAHLCPHMRFFVISRKMSRVSSHESF